MLVKIMKKYTSTIVIVSTLILAVGLIWWAEANQSTSPASPDGEVLSLKGMHAHPQLEIYVKGEKMTIPQNIGLSGAAHQPTHTHDDVPIIHLEYPARVTKDDTRLGKFFTVWGKDFREFGQTVTMTVNGEPNTELENYQMKDGDKIELRYE
jgi:hypothetical protein